MGVVRFAFLMPSISKLNAHTCCTYLSASWNGDATSEINHLIVTFRLFANLKQLLSFIIKAIIMIPINKHNGVIPLHIGRTLNVEIKAAASSYCESATCIDINHRRFCGLCEIQVLLRVFGCSRSDISVFGGMNSSCNNTPCLLYGIVGRCYIAVLHSVFHCNGFQHYLCRSFFGNTHLYRAIIQHSTSNRGLFAIQRVVNLGIWRCRSYGNRLIGLVSSVCNTENGLSGNVFSNHRYPEIVHRTSISHRHTHLEISSTSIAIAQYTHTCLTDLSICRHRESKLMTNHTSVSQASLFGLSPVSTSVCVLVFGVPRGFFIRRFLSHG